MDAVYDDMHKQARELQFRFEDAVDNTNHPLIHNLQRDVHGLVEDFESEKDPRHAEMRLKNMEHQVLELQAHGDSLMSFRDMQRMEHEIRSMRVKVRSMPNY
jgi:hypothetical protein